MLSRFGIFLLLGAAFGCAAAPKYTNNDVFAFKSPDEQRRFEQRARAGDIEAAQRLADFYFFFKYDPKTALYWARVCASHGSADCAKSVKSLREIIREQGL